MDPLLVQLYLFFLNELFVWYNNTIGEVLLLIFLVPTGVYFAFRFKFLHVTKFLHSFKIISGKYDKKEDTGDINHFKALTTALSATVGTGNIVGVSLAIYWGGPGAVFWMWVTGFFGMMVKFVECTLSFKFRKIAPDGTIAGGPMYYMEYGLKEKLGSFAKALAVVFAAATAISSLGQGNMAQSNSIADILERSYSIETWKTGTILALLVLGVIVGGIKRIAEVTSRLVPFMAAAYFLSAVTVIVLFAGEIPGVIALICKSAFTGTAAKGGVIGGSFIVMLREGVSRGIFSNEAGQGSAAIAHAAAKTKYPVREGLVASTGPLIDTLIICSLTAFVIILTGAWNCRIEGVGMTVEGFKQGFTPIGAEALVPHLVSGSLILFAFSTMISWSYYGAKATEYLLGTQAIRIYQYIFCIAVLIGAVGKIQLVWNFVDMALSMMTIPNLIAILLLAPLLHKDIKAYFSRTD